MIRQHDWPALVAGWHARDLDLLRASDGWAALRAPDGIGLWRRREPDDPNDLFRWHLADVAAPAEVVRRGFVRDILAHHREWTREYVDGRVVEEGPGHRVLYQRFDPGVPGIRPRDLCHVEVERALDDGGTLVSYRSTDHVPPQPRHERIDWWGATWIAPTGPSSCALWYLDRENQGGWVPALLMNPAMPRFLILQAEAVRRFFADGGPASLRA